jgi:hypothetical protein
MRVSFFDAMVPPIGYPVAFQILLRAMYVDVCHANAVPRKRFCESIRYRCVPSALLQEVRLSM